MSFGFVVARLGLFLQEFLAVRHNTQIQMRSFGFSLWFGVARIVMGVLGNVFARWHHAGLIGELDRGETLHSHPWRQALAIAFLVAPVGLAMTIYLLRIRTSIR